MFFYTGLLIVLILGIIIFNKTFSSKNILANYILNGETSYKVVLKDGNISNEKLFVSQAVNGISIKFNYKYSIDEKVNFKYRYEIISYVISDVDDNSQDSTQVYRKEEKILNTDYTSSYNSSINIDESIFLDYDYYNSIASAYNNSVNIPIKSKLLVNLNIYVMYEDGKENQYTSALSLPLEKGTFSIIKKDINESGIVKGDKINNNKLIINMLSVVFLAVVVSLIGYEIIKIQNYRKNHLLEFKYRKIMQDYSNVVVPILEIPNDKSIILIRVLYFKSMIDIQKELHVPILCYRNNQYTVYLILNQKLGYVYFLNGEKEKI